jgi:hypothetical protein
MTDAEKQEAHEKRIAGESRQVVNDLLLQQGLYSSVDTTTEVGRAVEQNLRESQTAFDVYCVRCRRETTFRISSTVVTARGVGGRYATQVVPPALFAVHATCQRDFQVYSYIFAALDGRVTKIGQRPSMSDIAFGELRSIDKSLDEVDRRELGKALGLFAHDSALGAFVYLRRVFERMIKRAHNRHSVAGSPIEGFSAMPMDRRIAALKGQLPDKVVRNSAVFSVLSLGLHELTEDQCAAIFPVMKAVLFQMLEQEEHRRKADITEQETDAELQRVLSNPRPL